MAVVYRFLQLGGQISCCKVPRVCRNTHRDRDGRVQPQELIHDGIEVGARKDALEGGGKG